MTVALGQRVIHTIYGEDTVRGLTVLNNELFVLRSCEPVDIYSTTDFTLLRPFTVRDAVPDNLRDIVSCSRKRCVYILDSGENSYCIHRLGLDGSVCKWPLAEKSSTVTVTGSSDLLLVCSDPDSITKSLKLISSENGECLRELYMLPELESDRNAVISSFHGIQLKDDLYAILYIDVETGGVFHVGGAGELLRTSSEDARLTNPFHMVTDADNFLLVADTRVSGIVVFDTSLDFVCDVAKSLVRKPSALHYDVTSRRLYVGQRNGKIVVMHL